MSRRRSADRAPKRPATPKASRLRRLLRGLLVLLIVLGGIAAAVAIDARQRLDAPLNTAGEAFEIPPGASLPRVLTLAATAGVLPEPRQRLYLGWLARLDGSAARIKAGEYRLLAGLTPRTLLALWVSGQTIQHELRLIEGWRFADALAAVRAHPMLQSTLPIDATPDAVMAALDRAGQPAEGRLFPDTYRFPKGATDLAVLRKAADRLDAVLAEAWDARAPGLPYDAPMQALTMASIVEKETGLASERPQIAGVFARRLHLGMRLQTDPTVIYGLGTAFDGDLRRRDLLADTPYNTYTRAGLPPTPICLAGRAAIEAALHPADGDALFFVARGDGSHQFSATLAEHDAAVRRYQLGGGP